jgi:hypothetical protein
MAMDDTQRLALSTLTVGQAAVFSEGDDAPLLVQVPRAKDTESMPEPTDDAVSKWMRERNLGQRLRPREFCEGTCRSIEACDAARVLAADPFVQRVVSRIVVSAQEHPATVDRQWNDLIDAVRARRPPHVDEDELLQAVAGHAADWLAQRRGAQNGWTYADTTAYRAAICGVLADKAGGGTEAAAARAQLARSYPA